MQIPNRNQYDEDAAGALALLMARHRRELAMLLGDPPNLDNVPQEFWDRVQQETEEELAALLLLVFIASGTFHGADVADAETQGALWSATTARQAAANYVQASRDIAARQDWSDITEQTTRIFGPNRAAKMGVDAVTTAQTAGGEWFVRFVGLASEMDLWKTNPLLSKSGPCEVCGPLDATPRSHWERVAPSGPPVHAQCVCEVIYENLQNAELN